MTALAFSPSLLPGVRPEELIRHIEEHKYLTNQNLPYELSLEEAYQSWNQLVYTPLAEAVAETGLFRAFPEVEPGELFLWVSRHWHHLKKGGTVEVGARLAVLDFGARFARDAVSRFGFFLKKNALAS